MVPKGSKDNHRTPDAKTTVFPVAGLPQGLVFAWMKIALIALVFCFGSPVSAQSGPSGSPSASGAYRIYEGEWALRILHKFGYLREDNGKYYAKDRLYSFLRSKHSETAPGPRGLIGFASDWNGDQNQPLPSRTSILLPDRGHNWQPTLGMCIPGHNMTHLTNKSEQDCKNDCLDHPLCKSVDYKPSTSECWLQDVDQTSGLLESCGGIYDHYSLGF